MIVLFSPTKTQKPTDYTVLSEPVFKDQAHVLQKELGTWNLEMIQNNYRVSEKLAKSIYEGNQSFDTKYCAVHFYQGSGFKALNPLSWDEETETYANDHMRILSALYGLLKPFDGIGKYRLDFLTKYPSNLYDLWRVPVTQALNDLNQPLINLASKEYAEMIDREAISQVWIDIDFKEFEDGVYKTKATYSKVARGTMASIILNQRMSDLDALKAIAFDGYTFNESLSSDTLYIYSR